MNWPLLVFVLYCLAGVAGAASAFYVHEEHWGRLPGFRKYPAYVDYIVGFFLSPYAIVIAIQHGIYGPPELYDRPKTHSGYSSKSTAEHQEEERAKAEDEDRRWKDENPNWDQWD